MRGGLVERAEDWAWSSAAAHCGRRDDPLLSPADMPWPVADWPAYLADEEDGEVATIRRQTTTGRPCGSRAFIEQLESVLSRRLALQKPGRKPKKRTHEQ